eukprot:45620-Prorocentrum_minimum.AAC.1
MLYGGLRRGYRHPGFGPSPPGPHPRLGGGLGQQREPRCLPEPRVAGTVLSTSSPGPRQALRPADPG